MKKRLIAVFLAVLMLAGCGNKAPAQEEPTEPTTGWYSQDSAVEAETGGAVRMYQVMTGTVTKLAMIGDHIALIEEGENTKITVVEAKEGNVLGQTELDANAIGLQMVYNALAYYQSDTKEAVYLDYSLQEVSRFVLPDEVEGAPAFALDSSEVYYCVGQDIKAFDTSLNIVRPVRNHVCQTQRLTGVHFGGAVLSCEITLEDGSQNEVYLSSETGELLCKDEKLTQLTTNQTKFICARQEGVVRQIVFGTVDGEVGNMLIPQNVSVAPTVRAGGIATYQTDDSGTAELAFYNTADGLKTAAVNVSGVGAINDAFADDDGLWILAEQESVQSLYYWTFDSSAITEDVVYSAPLYTPESPDEVGLKACQKRADEIANASFVDIKIWEDAYYDDTDFTMIPEYQTVAINQIISELEQVLARYPERFLYKSTNNLLRICIVRSVDGELKGAQFRRGNNSYIVLSVGCNVRDEFDKALGYVINGRVLGRSPLLDTWSTLNPEGFAYGETTDEAYLTGENQAFPDATAMNSVSDDRAMVFYHAMKADNGAVFQSPIMQAKLKMLCQGIRDAWGWEGEIETYPWEQYLNESIATQS